MICFSPVKHLVAILTHEFMGIDGLAYMGQGDPVFRVHVRTWEWDRTA